MCDFVSAQAHAEEEEGTGGGWVGYRDVYLSAEVQDLIRLRLQDQPDQPKGAAAAGDGVPKKRKLDASPAPAAVDDSTVAWPICSMDGTTRSVLVPENAPVAELKRAIGVLYEVPCFTIELFVKDVEEALADETPMRSLGKQPLFMLQKPASDRLALESFFKGCGGAGWVKNAGWMTEADIGEWEGVTVDAEGRVTDIDMPNNGLVGSIPSDIRQLSALQRLDLGNPYTDECQNKLTGSIPAELGQLRALTHLHLGNNDLSGAIPAGLGQLGALTHLDLSFQTLTGPIPEELRQLPAITYLYLDHNQLTGQNAFRTYMRTYRPHQCAGLCV